MDSFILPFMKQNSFSDYFITDPERKIQSSSEKDLLSFEIPDENFFKNLSDQKVYFSRPIKDQNTFFIYIGKNFFSNKKTYSLIFKIDFSSLLSKILKNSSMKKSVETYIISSNLEIISDIRPIKKDVHSIKNLSLVDKSFKKLISQNQHLIVLSLDRHFNYRGEEVIATWLWDPLFTIGMIVEIPYKDAIPVQFMLKREFISLFFFQHFLLYILR